MRDFKVNILVVQRKTKKIVEITILFNNEVIIKVWENYSYRVSGSFFNQIFFKEFSLLETDETLRYELTLINKEEELFELKFRTESFSKNPQDFMIGTFSAKHL